MSLSNILAASAIPEMKESDFSKTVLLWLVAIGLFMETLDSTIVNTAIPAMAKSLNENPYSMHSVVIAYVLTIALLIPASGWVADRFGTRRTYMSAIVMFTIGSLLCAVSQNLTQLVASRVLQGMGGALLLPIGRLAVLRAFPGDKFFAAISFVNIPGMIGPLLGPVLGGWFVEYLSWHWIFLINIPIGVLGYFATKKYMPDTRLDGSRKFDLFGFLILGVGMLSLSLSLEGLSGMGLPATLAIFILLLGLGSLVTYTFHARKNKSPLLPLGIFKKKNFRLGIFGNLFARIGCGAMPFMIPLYLQINLGYEPLRAGLMMLPVAISAIVFKPIASRFVRKYGYRNFLVTNTLLVGVAIICFAALGTNPSFPVLLTLLTGFGVVNAMQFISMNTLALKDLEPLETGTGNSMLSMTLMLAMSLGVATAGGLLSSFTAYLGGVNHRGEAFQATFLVIGIITCITALIFSRVDGQNKKAF